GLAHGFHVLLRHPLLRESGGFEGVRRFMKPGIARNPSIAKSPQRRLPALQLDAASSPTRLVPHHHCHLVSDDPELLRLHVPGLPPLENLPDRSAECLT